MNEGRCQAGRATTRATWSDPPPHRGQACTTRRSPLLLCLAGRPNCGLKLSLQQYKHHPKTSMHAVDMTCTRITSVAPRRSKAGKPVQVCVRRYRFERHDTLDKVFEATRAGRGHAHFTRHRPPSRKRVGRNTTVGGSCIDLIDAGLLPADECADTGGLIVPIICNCRRRRT